MVDLSKLSDEDLERRYAERKDLTARYSKAANKASVEHLRLAVRILEGGDTAHEVVETVLQRFADETNVFAAALAGAALSAREKAVVGKANCGCVHHAEEGIPCPHALAVEA